MKMTKTLAENIRLGIMDAKLDLAAGADNHDHEPLQYCGVDCLTGTVFYNKAAEKAYWHAYDHSQ